MSALTQRCHQAQQNWAQQPLHQRLKLIQQLRYQLIDCKDELCHAVELDLGRPSHETLPAELFGLAAACQFMEKRASQILAPRKISRRDRPIWLFSQADWVYRRPRGVVAIIGTWNFPLYLNGIQIIQALVAGNGLVWKPSEMAPHSAAALSRWLHRVEWPSDLFQVLPPERAYGAALLEADIDHLVFTGHVETGRKIAQRLGERLISSTLELSGHDAMFVLEDAQLDLVVRAAWFGLTVNASQTCIAVRRVLVSQPLANPLVERLQNKLATATPLHLVSSKQIDHAKALIEDAIAKGAQSIAPLPVLTSANQQMPPIILTNVQPHMRIWQEDLFAPVMTIVPFQSLEDALNLNQLCSFELGASIFTQSPERAKQIAARLGVGQCTINDVVAPTAHPATPFGGRKASGWGTTQGREGLLEMTIPQTVSLRHGSFRPHFEPPASSRMTQPQFYEGIFRWEHARTWKGRMKGLWQMLRILLLGKA